MYLDMRLEPSPNSKFASLHHLGFSGGDAVMQNRASPPPAPLGAVVMHLVSMGGSASPDLHHLKKGRI